MNAELTPQTIIPDLQNALQSLYDPVELGKNRLVRLLGLVNKPNPGLSVQDEITKAIQSLRPQEDVPFQSNAWRYFNILTYRYVEQTTQSQVAHMLGLSVRQLRRDERAAETWLAEYLWNYYQLDKQIFIKDDSDPQNNLDAVDYLVEPGMSSPSREKELEWLKESFPVEMIALEDLVKSAIESISSLLDKYSIELDYEIDRGSPEISGKVSAIRHALINILLASVTATSDHKVHIYGEYKENELGIKINAGKVRTDVDHGVMDEYFLMAQNLTEVFNGGMDYQNEPEFLATLWLPTKAKTAVMVVDDNLDTLQLLQRYLIGTPYQFVGVSDPESVVETAIATDPRIIIMDVMMPGMDEWELLGRIRNHPATRNVPVVICTILPQETLAFALGASGFIRKPVNRSMFLDILKQQIDLDLRKPN